MLYSQFEFQLGIRHTDRITYIAIGTSRAASSQLKNLYAQIVAIGQVVLCSLKIDSGDYGKMQAENGLPEECLSGDNNGTWWCKIIKNDDNGE